MFCSFPPFKDMRTAQRAADDRNLSALANGARYIWQVIKAHNGFALECTRRIK